MRKTLFVAMISVLVTGCNQPKEQTKAKYENVLRLVANEDGTTQVHAKRTTESEVYEAHTSFKAISMVGLGAQKIDFGDCGRIMFTISGKTSDIVNGLHIGLGLNSKCDIRNWDGEWRVIR